MKKLVILGAGGHGKVVADIAVKNGYEEIVFLDDNKTSCAGFSVVGKIEDAAKIKGDKFVAIGDANLRQKSSVSHPESLSLPKSRTGSIRIGG